MVKKYFIVRLNRVDYLTVTGIFLASCSGALINGDRFSLALAVLFLAMLVDALDGILARKFHLERDFGRYLDGFVDVFDYLVIPSFFLYRWGFNNPLYSLILVVFMICGVIRLSVFNEIGNIKNEKDELSYLGMPVFWSVLFLGFIYIFSWIVPLEIMYPITAVIFAVFSALMIYNGRFYKFKNFRNILMVVICFITVLTLDGFDKLPSSEIINFIDRHQLRKHFLTAALFIIPGMTGGILHMIAVSKNWLSFSAVPVSRSLFGENKTLRGFILMPVFTIFGAFVLKGIISSGTMELSVDFGNISFVLLGLALGLSYVLFELPNSFIKRRLDIKPGEMPEKNRLFFTMLDQFDSCIGGAIVLYLFFNVPLQTIISIIILTPVIALTVKKMLVLLKLKKG